MHFALQGTQRLPNVRPGPDALTEGNHARRRRALARLPEAQRRTLEVGFFEGLTYIQIVAREEVPLGTINSRAARAILALREALALEAGDGTTDEEGESRAAR